MSTTDIDNKGVSNFIKSSLESSFELSRVTAAVTWFYKPKYRLN